MMISPVNDMGYSFYDNVQASYRPGQGLGDTDGRKDLRGAAEDGRGSAADAANGRKDKVVIDGRNFPEDKAKGKKGRYGFEDPTEECQTCKKRKYQDGSDDMGVSFQTPTNIAPEQAASAVRGHENEHVVRERAKADREDRRVVSQSVTLHTDICPECGKTYISGGTTRTVTAAERSQETQQEAQDETENKGFSVFG